VYPDGKKYKIGIKEETKKEDKKKTPTEIKKKKSFRTIFIESKEVVYRNKLLEFYSKLSAVASKVSFYREKIEGDIKVLRLYKILHRYK